MAGGRFRSVELRCRPSAGVQFTKVCVSNWPRRLPGTRADHALAESKASWRWLVCLLTPHPHPLRLRLLRR